MLLLKIVNVSFVEERHMRPSGRIAIIQIQQYTVPDEKSVRLSPITSAPYLDIFGLSFKTWLAQTKALTAVRETSR